MYREISLQIRAIFFEYTDLVEPLSLDEAYLDVTNNLKGIAYASQIAKEIRARIWEETRLTASGGIGPNKFLSKMASDVNKPNGQYVITPERAEAFVENLKVGKFHGIGDKTEQKMNRLGIYTGLDLKARSAEFLQEHFGKAGAHYYWISRGVDERPVQPDRERKSVGAENTFAHDLSKLEDMEEALVPIVEKVWSHCEKAGIRGRSVTLKVKYADFQQITRSHSLKTEFERKDQLSNVVSSLLNSIIPLPKAVRLLGVSLSGLRADRDGPARADGRQLSLEL